MKSLFHSLALCIMWFTRIPIPWQIGNAERLQQQSLAWLPGIGILVGFLATSIVEYATGWPLWLGALVVVALTTWLTGGLHEDGWADGWDALGAGGDATKKLAVLKDPRLGTYGVTALLFSIAIQVSTLSILVQHEKGELFILAHAASRFPLPLLAWTIPYVRQGNEGKAAFLHQKTAPWAWLLWLLWIPALLIFVFSSDLHGWLVAAISIVFPLLAVLPWIRSLGGMTGDIFGFCQQSGLLVGLLFASWGIV